MKKHNILLDANNTTEINEQYKLFGKSKEITNMSKKFVLEFYEQIRNGKGKNNINFYFYIELNNEKFRIDVSGFCDIICISLDRTEEEFCLRLTNINRKDVSKLTKPMCILLHTIYN